MREHADSAGDDPYAPANVRAYMGLDEVGVDHDTYWQDLIRSKKKAPGAWYVEMTAITNRAYQLQLIRPDELKRRFARVLQYCDTMDGVIWVDEQMKTSDPKGHDAAWKGLVNKQTAKIEGSS